MRSRARAPSDRAKENHSRTLLQTTTPQHLVHFLLDHGVQLVFKLQRLQVVHVAIAIMKVSIQGCPGFLLALTCSFGVVFIVPIAVIPGASMRLPGAKTNPAKVSFAGLVLANHVITTSVLFDDRPAFGTLFG